MLSDIPVGASRQLRSLAVVRLLGVHETLPSVRPSVLTDGATLTLAPRSPVVSFRLRRLRARPRSPRRGGAGTLAGIEDVGERSPRSMLTDPDEAVRFAAATEVDALAIAVGTSHGAYS